MGVGASRLRELWRGLEPRGQLTIVGSGLLVVVTLFLLYTYASKPGFTPVGTGLDPSKTAQMTKALESAGIAYRIGSGGTEVDVPDGSQSAARVALASKGLLGGSQVGLEIFDKQGIGATDFQQKIDYQRGLEGEVARAVEQVDGVTSADVQLVLPDDTLFADSAQKASAAVLLTTATALDPSAISGIAHLVASAVKGLAVGDVTITDQSGTLLWPTADSTGGTSATATLRADQLYAAQLSASIDSLLASTVGAGKAEARVHADLNTDQTTIDKVQYSKKGTPLADQTQQETLQSKGTGAAVPAGTSANTSGVPTYAGTGSGGSSNYKSQSSSTTYGVDKTVSHTTVAPGTVRRLDVALLVDTSVPQAQVTALQKSVASLAGIDTKRGDTLAVSRIAFAKPPSATTTKAGPLAMLGNVAGLAKLVLAVVAAIVFLLLMRRGLKRREREGIAPEPTWLREIARAVPVGELEAGLGVRRALGPGVQRSAGLKAEAEEIAINQPEQIAAQVGQWLKE